MRQVQVFWVVTPCSVVVGDQRFGGTWLFHLQVSYHSTTEDLDLKHRRRESLETLKK